MSPYNYSRIIHHSNFTISYAFEEYDEQEQEKRAIEERRKRREALQAEYEHSKKTDTPSKELTPVVGDIKGKTADSTDTIPAVDYSDKLDRPEHKQIQLSNTPDDDNEDDMFALSNEHLTKKQKTTHNTSAGFTADGATDPEGYYATTLGEKLDNGRYLVFAMLGSGMFSNVVRVKDSKADDKEYAVKIIRSQESMYKAAQKEITLLERLKELDEDDKKHVIRLERTFEHRGHLCIVFENLRWVFYL